MLESRIVFLFARGPGSERAPASFPQTHSRPHTVRPVRRARQRGKRDPVTSAWHTSANGAHKSLHGACRAPARYVAALKARGHVAPCSTPPALSHHPCACTLQTWRRRVASMTWPSSTFCLLSMACGTCGYVCPFLVAAMLRLQLASPMLRSALVIATADSGGGAYGRGAGGALSAVPPTLRRDCPGGGHPGKAQPAHMREDPCLGSAS